MIVRTVAPAKINWTLEVLGKRDDGYHEIKSIMQTIDLCDEVVMSSAPELLDESRPPEGLEPGTMYLRSLPHRFGYAADEAHPSDRILGESVVRVVQMLDPDGQKDVRCGLIKHIPIAAGLGGGSSDAAAAFRGLNVLWDLKADRSRLRSLGIQIGSDVPFFLYGGTALAEGRGERVTALPEVGEAWLVILRPPIWIPEKTKRMYQALTPDDFTDGQRTEALVGRVKRGETVRDEHLRNAFERAAYVCFSGLDKYGQALLAAGASVVHLAGAGPALFAVFGSEGEAREVAHRIQTDGRVFVARTLGAEEATRVDVSGDE
jgi:4-diphosphocytidyl-2-C-methyl-D-erythritol kinase